MGNRTDSVPIIPSKFLKTRRKRLIILNDPLANVPLSCEEDVQQAVVAASVAFEDWKITPVPRRARILFRYQQLLTENWESLAQLITKENGKTYEDAYG